MTTNYNVTGDARKALVKTISDHLGIKAVYLRAPSYAFRIGDFTVTRKGALEFDDRLDSELVEGVYAAIAAEGFDPEQAEETAEESHTAAQEGESAEAEEPAVPEKENAQEAATEPEGADGATEEAAEATEASPTEEEANTLTVSLPLTGHTGASLRNLVSMVFSRGKLLSKATGGAFSCTEELADVLKDDACVLTTESLRKAVTDFESEHGTALTGLSFTEDKVTFTFPFTEDPEKVQTFQQLACRMCKLAREQKRTLAREVDDTNERYIFRIWLLRLGMAGSEFKTARKVLLAPLSGSAAFKDQAMEDRWKVKQAAKRDALRAQRESDGTQPEAEEETKEVADDAVSE